MARPCKSAKILTECSQTKEEINSRIEKEKLIRGNANNIIPSMPLTESQYKLFEFIVDELKASEILSNLDKFLLTKAAIAIDRLHYIESLVNQKQNLLFNKDVMSKKDSYDKDFYRCCNELCLSPQSRAKIANININAKNAEEDAVIKVLRGE
ncbi:P27 family phage terminase small subunit [Clostridium botulinum]|uniref:P27 family phage terminase small subunit n=1 Tax=Clostridium botulinum TaxID=1491 RepID=UPI0007749A99|nr:P27 family phage terminase small subunit [Clostridium botulinum]NFH81706.1 P27 family phage terminase small subunit [Clostridium botulinum]NFH84943.1 P27 family phage terminase small subunit [Clostridium botulinum]NFI12945.1 P27 family phage terminase small subunit [Clostridium botulinum]NFI16120.1 P27 family phage terminase small subunit [Clostridium botulinum]NFO85946.1 P27 family phage terminase small subunit [Clostridium botulinum]